MAFAGAATPAALALDLAIQSRGLLAVPLAPELAPAAGAAGEAWRHALAVRRCELWAAIAAETHQPGTADTHQPGAAAAAGPEGEAGRGAPPTLELPADDGARRKAALPPPPPAPAAAGVLVDGPDGSREWTPADLMEVAARLRDLVARPPGLAAARPSAEREIVVAARPLADPAGRALLAWATVEGAVLLLEPDPGRLVATAAWARPTLFHGRAAELAALREIVEAGGRRFWRRLRRGARRPTDLPFGRLRNALVVAAAGEASPDAADLAFWESHGVRVAAAPVV